MLLFRVNETKYLERVDLLLSRSKWRRTARVVRVHLCLRYRSSLTTKKWSKQKKRRIIFKLSLETYYFELLSDFVSDK